MKAFVKSRDGKQYEYDLPEQFNEDSSVKEIEHYVASIHSDHMIYIDIHRGFIDWTKGIRILFEDSRNPIEAIREEFGNG